MLIRPELTDEGCMRQALRLAATAGELDEVPVGAIVVYDGRVVARAHNQVETLKDATAHAEMIALTQAAAAVGDWRLTEATLYVTKEPCAMCAGAMVNARLGKLVFGLPDPRMGAAGGALNITDFEGMLHRVEVVGGVLLEECQFLIQDFFRRRRMEQKEKRDSGEAKIDQ
ncbi:MAG: tRNA adenosine(34) deaminase TadA [Lentisphaeria bacterium]|nr:tRNA adenosine(34) deaminase TadA [Lentisphaeria bacterium]